MANRISSKIVEISCKTSCKTRLKSLFKTVYNFFPIHTSCVNPYFPTSFFRIFHHSSHTPSISVNPPFFHYSTAPITTITKNYLIKERK